MAYHHLNKQVLYRGKRIQLEIHRLENENGRQIEKEVLVHNGAVVILPIVDDDHLLLIRNHRHAVNQILIELPAGTLEKGEDPINCAGRELLEETGYLAGRLKPIGSFFASPGIITEKMYAFAAYNLQQSTTALEDGEEIEVFSATWLEAIEMIRTGQIADSKTIATLLLYDKFFRARATGSETV